MCGRRVYGSLTGSADLYAMPMLVERYLKFAGFSLCALAMGVCARFGPAEPGLRHPEPRVGLPPETVQAEAAITAAEQLAALEAEMDALAADAADIQLALKVMGPLPDPGVGTVHAAWPDAARPPAPRTIYSKISEPTSIAKAAAILFPVGADSRLVVSSPPGEGAHDALCVELAALAGACRPAAPIRAYR